MPALLLADGSVFEGELFGNSSDCEGEVVFTTAMAGYPETLTDPSFRGQILVFTYPLIGNYGVPSEELNEWGFSKHLESEAIHVRGVIFTQASTHHSHHEAVSGLQQWLQHHRIPALTSIDTRALTKRLRERGVMLGRIVQDINADPVEIENPLAQQLVAQVSCKEIKEYELPLSPEERENKQPKNVIVYDCGMKRGILRNLIARGLHVIRVPWDFDLDSYDGHIDGVLVSNGPGDPTLYSPTIQAIKKAIARNIPTFGICLGHQLMALAAGAHTYKMPYGHRGMNQPCLEIGTGRRCLITSQNHGFAVSEQMPLGWDVWFRNANDGTIEGIRHISGKFFAVQFHPEACPGPKDSNYLFDHFVQVMEEHSSKYSPPHVDLPEALSIPRGTVA